MNVPRRIALAAGLALLLAPMSAANSAELKIFGSRVTRMVIGDMGPGFEQATGHRLTVVTDVAAVMKRRIEQGEPFDLAVLVNFQTDDLIRSGKLIAETRADIMKAGIGVAVRRGAPKPDISTVEAFTRTLLAAKSITYLKEGASTIHLDKVFAQLGIADALKAKTIQPTTESVSEMVAAGEVELGIRYRALKDRLTVKATSYNTLNARHYQADEFQDFEPRNEYLPNPYEDFRFFGSITYSY